MHNEDNFCEGSILRNAMESGNNASGRLGSLLPGPDTNPNSGIFQLLNR